MTKKMILCTVLAAAMLSGGLFAQGSSPQGPDRPASPRQAQPAPRGPQSPGPGPAQAQRPQPPEKTTVTGVLGVSNGRIALQSSGAVYYLPGLRRLIGFVDGLKEGAQVTVEGYAFTRPDDQKTGVLQNGVLRMTKLTLNGKDYDMGPVFGEGAPRPGFDGRCLPGGKAPPSPRDANGRTGKDRRR